MYLETPLIMKNSLHLHIKSQPTTIPPYYTTTVNVHKKYKIAIIKNLIPRAFYISSAKTIFYKELTNIK